MPERMNPLAKRQASVLLPWMLAAATLSAGSIQGSKHDLSNNTTPGSTQVCLFCHTPHRANNTLGPAFVPLWNRYVDTSIQFVVFTSASMTTTPDNPSGGPSAACLGCHDGTMANVTVYGVSGRTNHDLINTPDGTAEEDFRAKCLKCHTSTFGGASTVRPNLKFGKDLRMMHPISMRYSTAAQNGKFRPPTDVKTGWSDVKLYNGKVECASCHNVHDPDLVPFLRKTLDGSALCLVCHIK